MMCTQVNSEANSLPLGGASRAMAKFNKNNGIINRVFPLAENEFQEEAYAVYDTIAPVQSGDVAVLSLNGETLLKKYVNNGKVIMLIEPNADPIIVQDDDILEIYGKIVQTILRW